MQPLPSRRPRRRVLLACAAACAALAGCGASEPAPDPLRVAVAASLQAPGRALVDAFAGRTGASVAVSTGSTGALAAQILQGAPVDVFLAADAARPRRLASEGVAVPGSRFAFAVGRLVLWSARPGLVDPEGRVLRRATGARIALANPRLAPYGEAARQTLEALGLWEATAGRRVLGESVGQVHRFVASGNAELGFVALSQLLGPGAGPAGSRWRVPAALHDPIVHEALAIDPGRGAADFLAFVRSGEGLRILERFGLEPPDALAR